jgi:beta-lactamase superfamily II metal-dependent hydrolase
MPTHFIAADLVKVYKEPKKSVKNFLIVLAWGDEIELLQENEKSLEIALKRFVEKEDGSIIPVSTKGYIMKSGKSVTPKLITPIHKKDVLMVTFVDVQQGDACLLETPKGKTIIIDGGENQMFARFLAARFTGTSLQQPKKVDCIIVSHGDADHFAGLPKILDSEENDTAKKRIFINPQRVYHNGLVKHPLKDEGGNSLPGTASFGAVVEKGKEKYVTGLVDDLLLMNDKEMNTPFRRWKKTIAEYKKRNTTLLIKRIDNTSTNDFDFLSDENINVTVFGPMIQTINNQPALKFLRTPAKSVEIDEEREETTGAFSASHTINGHSIILKFTYGNVNFLFAGDLNEEAEKTLVTESTGTVSPIRSEILKVPHHGSADFSNGFFEAVNPLVSIVSSGDESEIKEYIHPRATLMGVLGKYSRTDRPIVFVTELVAFFKREGWSKVITKGTPLAKSRQVYAFSRTAYGAVHVRTNGKKLLVFTASGQKDMKEAYSFMIDENGDAERKDVVVK